MKIQLTIQELKEIIECAEDMQKYNSSLSNTLEFELKSKTDTYNGNDRVLIDLKSIYSECNNGYVGIIK